MDKMTRDAIEAGQPSTAKQLGARRYIAVDQERVREAHEADVQRIYSEAVENVHRAVLRGAV